MKVLFVCTGNICRSPIAERMLRQRSDEAALNLIVSSAGTRALNGKPMHPESVRVLTERGIDSSGFASRLLTPNLVTDADLVLGLTRDHRAAARQLAPVRWRRMYALREIPHDRDLSVAGNGPGFALSKPVEPTDPSLDIEDPIGRSAEVFNRVAHDIEATMDDLVAWFKHQLPLQDPVHQEAK